MTDNNIFQEINDELDRQKLEKLWKRYGALVIFGACLIVLATAVMSATHAWHVKHNQAATSQLIELLNPKDTDLGKQIDALQSYAQKYNRLPEGTLAQLRAAALALQDGKKDEAIKIYSEVTARAHDPALAQFALLRSVELQMSDGDAAALSKQLDPLMNEKAPWRFSAMEDQGYLALRLGDTAKARDIFTSLFQNAEAPASLSARAGDVLHALAE